MAINPVKVKKLFVNCHGIDSPVPEVDFPAWDEVETAIRSLDGKNRDQVILIIDDGHSLLIGGGECGVYFCEAELPNGQFVLTDPSKSSEKTLTIMNGQPGDYVESHTIDLNAVLAAAKSFYDLADIAISLTWAKI